ncbi:MAG: hypothetical protein KY432_11145 [Acidobacteria bacterium]|nr:hypothetical protein [Acidobacteriota bacterium]
MKTWAVTLLALFAALPSAARTLEASIDQSGMTVYIEAWGKITVTGQMGGSLIATLSETERGFVKEERQREPYGVRISGNRAFVWSDLPGDITLIVPRASRIVVRSLRWGDVEVNDICGDVEATAHEGGIRLTRIGGAVVAHAGNGPVEASLAWSRAKPASFTSMHGAVSITVPVGLGLAARLKTEEGRIQSAVPWEEALKMNAGKNQNTAADSFHLFVYTRFGPITISRGQIDDRSACE